MSISSDLLFSSFICHNYRSSSVYVSYVFYCSEEYARMYSIVFYYSVYARTPPYIILYNLKSAQQARHIEQLFRRLLLPPKERSCYLCLPVCLFAVDYSKSSGGDFDEFLAGWNKKEGAKNKFWCPYGYHPDPLIPLKDSLLTIAIPTRDSQAYTFLSRGLNFLGGAI